MPIHDRELKQAALVGLHHERQRMDELIARLERELEGGVIKATRSEPEPTRRKRRLSAAGRARIVAVLKKRWAAVKNTAVAKPKATKKAAATTTKRNKAAAKPSAKKRILKKPAATKRTGPKAAASRPAPTPLAEAVQTADVPTG
jgi:hypothetical protein